MLDVLLAQRRTDETLDGMDEAERVATDAKEKQTTAIADIASLKRAISESSKNYSSFRNPNDNSGKIMYMFSLH